MIPYSYDPFGNLLSNQTIYNPKLFIGRDDCLYDSEIDLYYMHARYYDPETGRFIMKDPVSGSLGNPITQNSYIYCANDPINKIDPGGNQFILPVQPDLRKVWLTWRPFDFGTNTESKSKPPICFSDCCINWGSLPNGLMGNNCSRNSDEGSELLERRDECNIYCRLEGDGLFDYFYDPDGFFKNNDPTTASTVFGGALKDFSATSNDTPDSGIIKQENKDYDIKWELDEDGNVKLTPVDKDGNPVILPESEQRVVDAINKGINDGLDWLGDQGFKFNDVRKSKAVIMNFINKYASMFYRITGGETPENAYELAYNATVGLAITSQMQRYSNSKYNRYDQEIGFWTSFWARKSGLAYDEFNNPEGMKFKSDRSGPISEDDASTLVDLANIVKAIAYQETHVGTDETTNIVKQYAGIMQVGYGAAYEFQTNPNAPYGKGLNFYNIGDEFFVPFNNIGIGIGCLFAKLTIHTDYSYNAEHARYAPKISDWLEAVAAYGPSKLPSGQPSYRDNIKGIVFEGYSKRDKEKLFNP